jgi:hypothetical protein
VGEKRTVISKSLLRAGRPRAKPYLASVNS